MELYELTVHELVEKLEKYMDQNRFLKNKLFHH